MVEAQERARKEREQQLINAHKKGVEDAAKSATTNLVRAGSKEMFEQVAKAQFKKENPLATFQKKSVKIQTDQLTTLKSIDRNLKINPFDAVIGPGGGGNGGGANIQPVGLGE